MRKLLLTALVFGLIVAVTTYSNAQPGRMGRGGFGGDPTTLIVNKSVQEELKITTEQKEKLEPKLKEFAEKRKEAMADFKGFDEETRAKRDAKMKEISEPYVKFIDETLNTEQKTRFKQIRLQQRRLAAFSDEEVVKALTLTDEQKAKIKSIGEETAKESGELRKEFKDNFAEAMKKMTALNKESLDKAVNVLDKAQKTKWEEMIGKPFEVKFEAPMRKKNDN